MLITPAFRRLKRKDHKFKANLKKVAGGVVDDWMISSVFTTQKTGV